jgi:hypothetical protein
MPVSVPRAGRREQRLFFDIFDVSDYLEPFMNRGTRKVSGIPVAHSVFRTTSGFPPDRREADGMEPDREECKRLLAGGGTQRWS